MSLQVFISYKRKYEDFAREVKEQIHAWGYGTWFDRDDIPEGTYFRHAIQKGLETSEVMVGVLTEEAIQSREVQAEWDYFFIKNKDFIPLRYQDIEPPYHLLTIQYIDFIENRALAFERLKHRLSELAASHQPAPIVTEQKPEPQPTSAPVDAEQVHKPSPPKPSKKRDEAASSVVVGKLEDEEAEAAMPDRLADTVEAEPAPAEDDDEYGVADEAQEKDAAAAFDDGVTLPDLAPQAPPREPPKPAPITAPITVPAAQPAPDAAAMGGAVPQPAPVGTPYTPSAPPPQQALYDRPSAPKSGSRLPIWALSAAAVLIVAVGVVALLPNLAALTPNVTETSSATSPLLLALGALVVGAVGVFVWRRSRRSSVGAAAPISPVTELANRSTMLDKVEEFWIRGVLDKALEAGQFEMGLAAAPGAVLRHVDYGDYPLPPNASIAQIFEDLNRELLILGAPGGGKTVLLLQLAKALIEEARRSPHPPTPSPSLRGGVETAIPVVFNLSSWAAGRKPLADWLVDELRLKYQVPKKVAQEWVEREQILPLLDGLDEVAEQYRNDCVEAINSFRQQYRAVDMAVCSRSADYDLLTSKLDVRGAVVLQPLDDDQINRFLDRPDLDGLRQVMKDDDELRGMTHTPFLLNSMAYAYAGASVNTLQIPTSDDKGKARRTHLFDRLVEKRLVTNPHEKYTARQSRHWLGWLASKMTEFKQTTFYIEGLQPEWIEDVPHHYLYQLTPVSIGIFVGAAWFFFRDQSLIQLIAGGIIGAFFGSYIGQGEILVLEKVNWSRDGAIISMRSLKKSFWENVGIFAAFTTIVVWMSSKEIIPGIIAGMITLIVGISIPILLGGFLYNNFTTLPVRTKPNQAIFKTIRYGIASLAIFIVLQIILFEVSGIYYVFAFLLFGYLWTVVVQIGLGSTIRHTLIRLVLWRSGDAPLNYARFLDYCASAGLLRKVGGGYIFVHRYLLEYFAG